MIKHIVFTKFENPGEQAPVASDWTSGHLPRAFPKSLSTPQTAAMVWRLRLMSGM